MRLFPVGTETDVDGERDVEVGDRLHDAGDQFALVLHVSSGIEHRIQRRLNRLPNHRAKVVIKF